MEPEKNIASNIHRIRKIKKITINEIAESAGISRQAYSNIEKGKTKQPKVSNLQAIADVLEVKITSLFAEPPKLHTVRFRTNSIKTEKDKAKKEQYLIETAQWLKNFNYLQSIVGDKKQTDKFRPISSNIPPQKAASQTRQQLGLKPDEPIFDILDLIEHTGIKIKVQEFDLPNFFGFSVAEHDGGPAIIVNSANSISVERQIFTVAHELGHLLLHPSAYQFSKIQESIREERQADCFASHFLMPQIAFEKKLNESYGLEFIDKIIHIKRYFGVSYKTVLLRMAEMGISDRKNLFIKFNTIYKKKYNRTLKNHREPYGLEKFDFIEDNLKTLVRKALDKNEITVSRAAEILGIKLGRMREIINSWEVAA